MKVGLFGGSFDPVHLGHEEIIRAFLDSGIVDQLWVLPCKYQRGKNLVNCEHRMNMLELVVGKINGVKISGFELQEKKPLYTIDTLRKLRRLHDDEFLFIIGSDLLYTLQTWHMYEELLKEVKFIVHKRKDYPFKRIQGLQVEYFLERGFKEISSTEVGEKIKKGQDFQHLVSSKVADYIIKNNLYHDGI